MSARACIECASTKHRLSSGREAYPHRHDLHSMNFWFCECGAFVGCHPGTDKPLGAPAGQATKRARSDAHKVFDRMWKQKRMGRSAAYKWLAAALGIEAAECHIGHMNRETARRVVSIVHEWEAENVHRLPRQLPAVPA